MQVYGCLQWSLSYEFLARTSRRIVQYGGASWAPLVPVTMSLKIYIYDIGVVERL
jgi:hypothetical protein